MRDLPITPPDWLDVSRETLEKLEAFAALVLQWNRTINLISKASSGEIWQRHVLDSAQLMLHFPPDAKTYVDIGSGGGFPGIVLAIIAAELMPGLQPTLVESDLRKTVFLNESSRKLGLAVNVLRDRAEAVPPLGTDIVTARALAPLGALCAHAERHLAPTGVALFLKGNSHAAEVAAAQQEWRFDLTTHPSKTDPDTALLALKGISHV